LLLALAATIVAFAVVAAASSQHTLASVLAAFALAPASV
jgi:hypothetical protein